MSSSKRGRFSLHRRDLLATAVAAGAAAILPITNSQAAGPLEHALSDLKDDAVEQFAYLLGMEAYVYGFPLVMMDATNRVETAVSEAGEYAAPMNQLLRMRGFVSPDFKNVVRISVNSIWSGGIFDLEKEPLVFSYPDTAGRYFVLQLLNMWTDDFGSVGTRTTGKAGGNFLIAGPKWNGTPPPDVKTVYRCSTRYGWVLTQMAAAGPQDFPAIHKLQDQLNLTPLSAWGTSYSPPKNVPVDPDVDLTATPYDQVRLMTGEMFFKRLAFLLKDNPPYPADAPMLAKLKRLGVEPGKPFDRTTVEPAILRGLNRVPAQVWYKFQTGPYTAPTLNGWQNMLNIGRFGTDYATRAFVAWFGLGALTADDAVYPTAFVDGDGEILDGSQKYLVHFAKDEMLPSESGVWSISPYRENFYVRNAIERYGITSGMPLKYSPDGSFDVYIQARSPGADKEANWLPCPPSGAFNLSIRVYQPKERLKDNTFRIPPIQRIRDS
ncbi:DUF1254 domain-containing protein [uncultured Bradyrhizobium sp.]|jgi:hypothetical protein|uniref:DUF1254 domain-containing protein n=1 Tax=uncultured Bradyrhizobium sp. TaxID=199684 RepID=UPI002634E786|nr:DUF1254 domain-containing protein [uncultured Bradyrhizobium sp.]